MCAGRISTRMANDENFPWPPAAFADQLREASEKATEQQLELWKQWLSAGAGTDLSEFSTFGARGLDAAVFKTRVQSGGRISIPDVEREALDINEGDIVQTVVIPIRDLSGENNE